MDRPLAGRSILIVEDEPLIALDIASTFEKAGAKAITATRVAVALSFVENDNFSAAVFDHALRDGDASKLCDCLAERNIPFVIYSGYVPVDEPAYRAAPHISKPANPAVVVATVEALLTSRSKSLN